MHTGIIKLVACLLYAAGFLRTGLKARDQYPGQPGHSYQTALLATAGALATYPTAIDQAVDRVTRVYGLGYLVCDELLSAAMLKLYQFTQEEGGEWEGTSWLAVIGWLLIPMKVSLWLAAKIATKDDAQLFYHDYLGRPRIAAYLRGVIAISMLYNSVLASAGYVSLSTRDDARRTKYQICAGVLAASALYAGVRLEQVVETAGPNEGNPRRSNGLLSALILGGSAVALAAVALMPSRRGVR
jgi:hypothetical protein